MKQNLLIIIILAALLIVSFFAYNYWESRQAKNYSNTGSFTIDKPAIYLYPTKTEQVSVEVKNATLYSSYPNYNGGWKVIAEPDGTLTNLVDNQQYGYLFWEGKNDLKYDLNSGFVIKGKDTAQFLQDKLSYLGLKPKEYNDFIVYWLPKMQQNPYNLIHFATKQEYDQKIPLLINPQPDSMLRVLMVYKPLVQPISIKEQYLDKTDRTGFSVVEWGGSTLK